jgi:hypothetical protein
MNLVILLYSTTGQDILFFGNMKPVQHAACMDNILLIRHHQDLFAEASSASSTDCLTMKIAVTQQQ